MESKGTSDDDFATTSSFPGGEAPKPKKPGDWELVDWKTENGLVVYLWRKAKTSQ